MLISRIFAATIAAVLPFQAIAAGATASKHQNATAAHGIPLVVKQAGECSAFAPADWSIHANPQASAVDLVSSDHRMYAGWGVAQINTGMRQYYGDFYADPETSMRTLATLLVRGNFNDRSGVQYTSKPKKFLNYFEMRSIASDRTSGLVFYKIYPVAWPQVYVESAYFAIADNVTWRTKKGTVGGVVVSIRCVTQLLPPSQENSQSSGREARPGCGYGGKLRGYNKELGTQYAHSASTGQNFLLDPTTDWTENGPDGAGYYRKAGDSYEKLDLGRDDDC